MKNSISIWEQETFFAPVDVIIVGAGFLGLWTALELITRNPGTKITIIEMGITPMGASAKNAGFACFGSPTELIADAEKMGEDAMWSLVEMRYKGIKKIRQYFADNLIDFDNCGGYECFTEWEHEITEVDNKLCWLNEGMQKITGVPESFTWSNKKMQQFQFKGFGGMIENTIEGGIHSGKLLHCLTRKIQSLGVNILTGIRVNSWQKTPDCIKVYTSITTLQTEQLVICTNAFSSQLIPNFSIKPARGQVFVTGPIENLKMKGTFHYDKGFYYFRNVGNRILIGGARNKAFGTERTDEQAINNHIQNCLERSRFGASAYQYFFFCQSPVEWYNGFYRK
ncbi:MAG: FAD-dependent oxidoreductase [Segetibacter sp.]